METAMELALARIEMLYELKDEIHWEMFKNDCMEKEKEQIIEAHAFGADDVDSNGGLLLRGVKNAIYYYNQTYQNK
jgi:hypothetical protein